jgi:hypothetical protein
MARAIDDGHDFGEISNTFGTSLIQQARDKTFLEGFSQVVDILEDPERAIATSASRTAAGFVPNIYRQPRREFGLPTLIFPLSIDPEVKEKRGVGKEGPFWDRFTSRLGAEVSDANLAVKVDLWGRPIKRFRDGETGQAAIQLFSQVKQFQTDIVRPDRVLLAWNDQHPEERVFPRPPSDFITIRGERVRMTPDEYHDFAVDAGTKSLEILNRATLNEETPTQRDIDRIDDIIARSRESARKRIRRRVLDRILDEAEPVQATGGSR